MTSISTKLKKLASSLIIVGLTIIMSCSSKNEPTTVKEDVPIIPYPAKVLKRSGYLEFDYNFWVIADVGDSSMADLGQYLVSEIDKLPGAIASIADLYSTRNHAQGYSLSITSKNIKIQARTPQGIFYGVQTVLALLRNQWNEDTRSATLRKMVITDQPLASYRAIHFNSIAKDSIDFQALVKFLGTTKINYLAFENYQFTENELSLLKENNIKVLDWEQDGAIVEPGRILSSNDVASYNNFSTTADSLLIKIEATNRVNILTKIVLGSQLAWSGASKKDLQWLKEQAENLNEFIIQ